MSTIIPKKFHTIEVMVIGFQKWGKIRENVTSSLGKTYELVPNLHILQHIWLKM